MYVTEITVPSRQGLSSVEIQRAKMYAHHPLLMLTLSVVNPKVISDRVVTTLLVDHFVAVCLVDQESWTDVIHGSRSALMMIGDRSER